MGAELKSTFCVTRGDEAFLSPHLGDLDSEPAYDAFHATSALPGCSTSSWTWSRTTSIRTSSRRGGRRAGRGARRVQHHHAHVAACVAEHDEEPPRSAARFDGTGCGTDGRSGEASFWLRRRGLRACRPPRPRPAAGRRGRDPRAVARWRGAHLRRATAMVPDPAPWRRRVGRAPHHRAPEPEREANRHSRRAWAGSSTPSPRCSASASEPATRARPRRAGGARGTARPAVSVAVRRQGRARGARPATCSAARRRCRPSCVGALLRAFTRRWRGDRGRQRARTNRRGPAGRAHRRGLPELPPARADPRRGSPARGSASSAITSGAIQRRGRTLGRPWSRAEDCPMCLAIPAQLVEIGDSEVRAGESRVSPCPAGDRVVRGLGVGDWALIHVGFGSEDRSRSRSTRRSICSSMGGASAGATCRPDVSVRELSRVDLRRGGRDGYGTSRSRASTGDGRLDGARERVGIELVEPVAVGEQLLAHAGSAGEGRAVKYVDEYRGRSRGRPCASSTGSSSPGARGKSWRSAAARRTRSSNTGSTTCCRRRSSSSTVPAAPCA